MKCRCSVTRCAWLLLLALSATSTSAAQRPHSVTGEYVRASKITAKLAAEQAFRSSTPESPALVRFKPIEESRISAIRELNGKRPADNKLRAIQVGIARESRDESLDGAYASLSWRQVRGGSSAWLAVQSPGARAIRASIRIKGLPPDLELRFAGSGEPANVVTAFTVAEVEHQFGEGGTLWTPITEGETQLIELFQPSSSLALPRQIEIPVVSHLFATPKDKFADAKSSGTCNTDVICVTPDPAFINARNAVAHMAYQIGGSTYFCTGNLINDSDPNTQIPYFYTANHCISTQAMASTLITYWSYQNSTCGGPDFTRSQSTARFNGATLLYADGNNDIALMRLNEAAPAGAYLSGWDADPLGVANDILVIHHPSGDPKKFALGKTTGLGSLFIDVGYTMGTTEGGSSGAGLLTFNGSEYVLRGGLKGGSSSCANTGSLSNPDNHDTYSRFDLAFPVLRKYLLDPQPVITPSAGPNGSISPAAPRTVPYGSPTIVTLAPDPGYAGSVGGTCGGFLLENTYVTSPITADCTVTASFTQSLATATSFPGTGVGAIPDSTLAGPQTPTGQRVISFAVSGVMQNLSAVSLGFNGAHTYIGDLKAVLAAPGGSPSVTLFAYPGATMGAPFGVPTDLNGSYLFGDNQTSNLCTAISSSPVASGGYAATELFTCNKVFMNPVFAGLTPAQINGTWTLTFEDGSIGGTGQINSAVLNISTVIGATLELVGPAVLNANAYLNYPYKAQATYADNSVAELDATWSVTSTAAIVRANNGLVTIGDVGTITLSAILKPPFAPVTISKTITIVNGADPNLPVPTSCNGESPVFPLVPLNSVTSIDTGSYADVLPLCGSVVLASNRRLSRMQVIDVVSGAVLSNWSLPGRPVRTLFSAGRTDAFVLTDTNQLVRIDLIAKTTQTAQISGRARGLTFGSGGEVWVANTPSNSQYFDTWISRFAADNLASLGTRQLSGGDGNIIQYNPLLGRLYIATMDLTPGRARSFAFDSTTGDFTLKQTTLIQLGMNGESLMLSPDFQHLAMTAGVGSDHPAFSIFDLNPASINNPFGEWLTGQSTGPIDFRFDSNKLAAGNYTNMQVFDVATKAKDLDLSLPCNAYAFPSIKWSPSGRNIFMSIGCDASQQFGTLAMTSLNPTTAMALSVQKTGNGIVNSLSPGFSCGAICTVYYAAGSAVTLVATPDPGYRFTSWSVTGGSANCPGTTACQVTLSSNANVTATFAPDSAPGMPRAVTAIPGNGRATFTFSPPTDDGGKPITRYTVDCNAGAFTSFAATSPIVLTGLTNATLYTCNVTAENSIGAGAPAQVLVTPSATAPIALVRVQSRRTHGTAGTFAIDLDPNVSLNGALTIEPRQIGTGHEIVFTFSDAVGAVGSATLTNAASAPIGNVTFERINDQVVMTLTNVPDNSRVMAALTGVNGMLDVQAAIGFLVGDLNNSGRTGAADIAAAKARNGIATIGNFKADINTTGAIDNADVSAIKARSGSTLQ